MRVFNVVLILFLLSGCATTQTPQPVILEYENHAAWMAAHPEVSTPPPVLTASAAPDAVPVTPPTADPGPSTGKIIATVLLLPIILPVYLAVAGLVVLSSGYRGGYGGGISCKGKIYADGTKEERKNNLV
jgi:hypothetical protein